MNVVDSSGWLEYFADTPHAAVFSKPVEDIPNLIVPVICLTEVFKRVLQQRSEQEALQAVAHMRQGLVVDLTPELAIAAARIGYDLKLPLADSLIWATTLAFGAVLWTQDDHFKNLEKVRYFSKDL
jgi:predicted nucleic acid-binding protein